MLIPMFTDLTVGYVDESFDIPLTGGYTNAIKPGRGGYRTVTGQVGFLDPQTGRVTRFAVVSGEARAEQADRLSREDRVYLTELYNAISSVLSWESSLSEVERNVRAMQRLTTAGRSVSS